MYKTRFRLLLLRAYFVSFVCFGGAGMLFGFRFPTSLFLIQLPWGSSSSKEMPTGNSQCTYSSNRCHCLPGELGDRGREQAASRAFCFYSHVS